MTIHKKNLIILAVLHVALLIVGCQGNETHEQHITEVDSILTAIRKSGDFDRLLTVVDSLEDAGKLNDVKANCQRGYAYYQQKQDRLAEMYYRHAMKGNIHQDSTTYVAYLKGMGNFTRLLVIKGDFEESIKVSSQLLHSNENDPKANPMNYMTRCNMLSNIAICYANLKRPEEADKLFHQAYQEVEKEVGHDDMAEYYLYGVANDARIVFKNQDYWNEAEAWSVLEEESIKRWETSVDGRENPAEVDAAYCGLYASRMEMLQRDGKAAEAAATYKKYLATRYANTLSGKLERIIYLQGIGHHDEAADLCRYIDTLLVKSDKRITMEIIRGYLKVKYRVLRACRHNNEALSAADQICDAFDSAFIWQKHDATAELATVYETQEKERTIAEQQMSLSQQRWIGTLVGVGLLIIFFVVYSVLRRRAARRLAEMKAAKERIESELRIARDIQMSMVPQVFPDCEGIDLYASMTPAREVGGDLYDYLLLSDHLYFCVGDVSGKGVPASLFMAQATRLFRALAKQRMMPADIANRLNAELSENNDSGMFVTMFIGLIDLHSGQLFFCNAGHNPPVLGEDVSRGSFLQMEANAPLGLWPDLEYVGESIDNITNRPLFIYTDGLNEAENPAREQFGDDRLLDILQHTDYANARQVIDTMQTCVEEFRQGADPNDDLTMMCLRVGQ